MKGTHPFTQMSRPRMRMDVVGCDNYASSAEGSLSLRSPQLVKKSSVDPNRYLRPRSAGATGTTPSYAGSVQHGHAGVPIISGAVNTSSNGSLLQDVKARKRACAGPSSATTSCKRSQCDRAQQRPATCFDESVTCTYEGEQDELVLSQGAAVTSCVAQRPASKEEPPGCSSALKEVRVSGFPQNHVARGARKGAASNLCLIEVSNAGDETCWVDSSDSDVELQAPLENSTDPFGVAGSGRFPVRSARSIDWLPPEVLAEILCQLPICDLICVCSRVCSQWNDIIRSPTFMPWKKRYYSLKLQKSGSKQWLDDLDAQFVNKDDALSWVVVCASKYKKLSPMAGRSLQSVTELLRRHPRYCCASGMLLDRFAQDPTIAVVDAATGQVNPWSLLASLVMLSNTTEEVRKILECLSCRQSCLSIQEMLDCLYFIACLLYYLQTKHGSNVWNGMHYRLYHCLDSYESLDHSSTRSIAGMFTSGQQSLRGHRLPSSSISLTHEQKRVVSCSISGSEILKIIAFAGTGKTACLIEYARVRPQMNFLYVVYNKSVMEHALKRFPHNVECRTGHSLAYSIVGKRYKWFGDLRVFDVSQIIPKRRGFDLFIQAKMVVDTIKSYIASSTEFITSAHVPSHGIDDMGNRYEVPHEKKMVYAKDAQGYWNRMVDVDDNNVCMTHDGYMKLWQLEGCVINSHVLKKFSKVDCILIDEAQDMSPALADVLLKQGIPTIVVGDPHQQIYAFRGAINVMNGLAATKTLHLTRSFRFGPQIGFVAATLLDFLKHEHRLTVVGCNKKDVLCLSGTSIGQTAVLGRTNYVVLMEAVNHCSSHPDSRIHLVGGPAGFNFEMIRDIYRLMTNDTGEIKNKLVKKFPSLGELEKFAKKVNEVDLMGKIKLVKVLNSRLPAALQQLEVRHTQDMELAEYVFSSAHRSKGLEFSTVKLLDDFAEVAAMSSSSNTGAVQTAVLRVPVDSIDEDERNLLYVATTRAKNCLVLNQSLYAILNITGALSELPMCPLAPNDFGTSAALVNCQSTSHVPVLMRQPLYLSNGTRVPGGPVDPRVVFFVRPAWSQLLALVLAS